MESRIFCPSLSLFLEKDVYNWIEHSNPRMMSKNIDEDEKVVNNAYTPGGNQQIVLGKEFKVYGDFENPLLKIFCC
mgnify:CR=1 FL=1